MKLIYRLGFICCNWVDELFYWGCRYLFYGNNYFMIIIINGNKKLLFLFLENLMVFKFGSNY